MLWIGIGVTLAVVIMVRAVTLAKRRTEELGSVSARWIGEHRLDSQRDGA